MSKEECYFGDMDSAEFRDAGHRMIDWIADYLENTSAFPVLSACDPGEIKKHLPENPPESGESFKKIFQEFEDH